VWRNARDGAEHHLGIVDAFGGTTAVYESSKNGRCIVRVSVAWKTEFVEHRAARFVFAGQAVASGEPA